MFFGRDQWDAHPNQGQTPCAKFEDHPRAPDMGNLCDSWKIGYRGPLDHLKRLTLIRFIMYSSHEG
jgi:hypothetical protein